MSMRFRITFSKAGPMQYVGHLDLHRAWERTFRRSGLPLEYSQGFHPQPHLNLACALPLGFTSQCELLDVWLEAEHSVQEVLSRLQPALPPGLRVRGLEVIDLHAPALQTLVTSTCYRIMFRDIIPDLAERLQRVLTAEQLPRLRRGKAYDLRPLIEDAYLEESGVDERSVLHLKMAARDSATGRPEELLAELGINFEDTQIEREKLVLNPN